MADKVQYVELELTKDSSVLFRESVIHLDPVRIKELKLLTHDRVVREAVVSPV